MSELTNSQLLERALICLHIAVDESVAKDVETIVRAYVNELKAALTAKEQTINEQAQTIARLLNVHNEHVALFDAKERELQELRDEHQQSCIAMNEENDRHIEHVQLLDQTISAMKHTIVATVGGVDYEGFPTSEINYLQRLRILVEKESQLETARGALTKKREVSKTSGTRRCEAHDSLYLSCEDESCERIWLLEDAIGEALSALNPSKEKE